MENTQKAVQIVTIEELVTIFKNGEPASSIELAHVEEHNFDIIVQKGLYEIGDKAVYIQPDFCLPLVSEQPTKPELLFATFTETTEDGRKSKLGKNGRIRAIKFNFSVENSQDPIYSFGVMLPINEVKHKLGIQELEGDLDELLQVTKYEEPESAYSGLAKGELPVGMYKTDETNFLNLNRVEYPIVLTGSIKCDGSSISIYYKSDEENGICSRSLEKKLEQKFVSGYKLPNGNELRKHFDREQKISGWFDEATETFYSEIQDTWIVIEKDVDDTFVKLGKPVLDKLANYCKENNKQLTLRGELCGEGLKGSGNKNNPHAKLKQTIKFYGLDDYSKGVTTKLPVEDFLEVTNLLGLEICDVVFKNKQFDSFDELKNYCNDYFKTNLIEGLVLRTSDSKFSAKFMNGDYDSKK
jgi:RNA ligase (TIGR02306 family)